MSFRLRLAVILSFACQGALILTGRYRLGYDAYTHMLLADHYRQSWWSLWETRWYAGFQITSYPPLVHQLMGLIGKLVGVDAAFALVLWIVMGTLPLACYVFCRVFVGRRAAEYAAIGSAFLPSLYLSAYVFGQLPTLTAALLALLGAAALAKFLRTGSLLHGLLAVSLAASVAAAHHATVLFLPWLAIAVGLRLLLQGKILLRLLFLRLLVYCLLASAAGLGVIWPFWSWAQAQTMQTPIDHLSRHNFITDPSAAILFFWPVYGPLVFLIPFLLAKALRRRYTGLAGAFTGLFLLGLGGTTPLPRMLFGAGWEWLTYDRFAIWASLLILPFLGASLLGWQRKLQWSWAGVSFGSIVASKQAAVRSWTVWVRIRRSGVGRLLTGRVDRLILPVLYVPLAITALMTSLAPTMLPTQPHPLDMRPVVSFLSHENRSQWRYITLGFGDQFAYLNRLTSASTLDGSYHTARSLPELRTSGLGQMDSAYWLPGGLDKLRPVLQAVGSYGVRWAFVNYSPYIPLLQQDRWVKVSLLSNGVQVWENPAASPPPAVPVPTTDPLENFSWGFLPLFVLSLTAALGGMALNPAAARKVLLGIHALAIGLLPLALVLWYFYPLTAIQYDRVYFTYDNALFFLGDGLALAAVLAWTVAKFGSGPAQAAPRQLMLRERILSFETWLLAFCLLVTASLLWSADKQVTLYFSLHCWLVFGLFLSLRDRSQAWLPAALGMTAALGLELLVGFWQFAVQSTAFLKPLHLYWPGLLDAATQGASVVQQSDQTRWLRVYGTLPHPNILGGLLVLLLAGPAILFLTNRRPAILSVLSFCLGLVLLVLTFSRGAWIGLAAGAGVVVLNFRRFRSSRLWTAALAGASSLAAGMISVRSLIFTRLGGVAVPTEAFSSLARLWLAKQALSFIQQHPLLGLGAGSFVLELSRRAAPGYIIEPVHNIPLLIQSELGILGTLALAGMAVAFARLFWQDWQGQKRPSLVHQAGALSGPGAALRSTLAVLGAASVLGLCVTGLFDHSLWTLAPGRLSLGLALGLWAGQRGQDES